MRNVLSVQAKDRPGLVYEISGVLYRFGLNVMENHEHVDSNTGRFFMRTEVQGELDRNELLASLEALSIPGATFRLRELKPRRAVMLVSKEHHCAAEILIRNKYQEINLDLVAVIGNHEDLAGLVKMFQIPFHFVPSSGVDRKVHEAEVDRILNEWAPELMILARYMRILSPEFVGKWEGRMINIHHSFLPAFVGARPYHQAFERGVKIIGATAHLVTPDLDQGPIITQGVIPVDHSYSAKDLAKAGRDIEKNVLAQALRLVSEDRVFICDGRTIVFS